MPLKHLVLINERALPETTDPLRAFRYLDIGAVGRGFLIEEPEETTFAVAPSRARRLVRQGDTILSTVRTYLRAVWPVQSSADDLVVSTGFAVLTPRPDLDARYLGWLAQSDVVVDEIVARSNGVSYPAINAPTIGEIRVPVPTMQKQRSIADFLNAETARIDALITKKQQLARMTERRWVAALIEMIGPGSNPGAPRLRRTVESSIGGSWGAEPGELDCDVMCVRGTDFDTRRLGVKIDSAPTRSFTKAELTARRLQSGDLIVEKSGGGDAQPVGRVVMWESDQAAVPTNFAARLRPNPGVSPRFLAYVFRSAYERGMTRAWIKQTTGIQNLDLGGLLSERWQLPALSEQDRLVGVLDTLMDNTIALQGRLALQIALLRERRQALITAAVTGELEIPGAPA